MDATDNIRFLDYAVHRYTAVLNLAESSANKMCETHDHRVQDMKVLGSVYPAILMLGFIPTGFGATTVVVNQTPVYWTLIALLIHCTVYLGSIVINSFYEFANKSILHEELVVGSTLEEAKEHWKQTISGLDNEKQTKRLLYTEATIDILFASVLYPIHYAIITLTCISVVAMLFQFEKSDNFDSSAYGQIVYLAWLIPSTIAISLASFHARKYEERNDDSPIPVSQLILDQSKRKDELAKLRKAMLNANNPDDAKQIALVLRLAYLKHYGLISICIGKSIQYVDPSLEMPPPPPMDLTAINSTIQQTLNRAHSQSVLEDIAYPSNASIRELLCTAV